MASFPAQPSEIVRFLRLLWKPGEVRELRVPKHNQYKQTASGYFDSPEALAEAAVQYDGKANAFVTLNPVLPDLLARAANRTKPAAESTTADSEITHRHWLLCDIDPVRPSGISSTEREQTAAFRVLHTMIEALANNGWPQPITAASGNGAYALYALDLPNDAESTALVRRALEALAARFNTSDAHIDTSVYNAARLVGIVGTKKVKGDPTPERPHRVSSLLSVPEALRCVSREQLQELKMPAPAVAGAHPDNFDKGQTPLLSDLLDRVGIPYRQQASDSNGITWFHVRQCPFHDDGRPFECGVGQKLPGGSYAGHCFHPEGQDKGWQEWKEVLGLSRAFTNGAGGKRHDYSIVTDVESYGAAGIPQILITNRHLHDIAADAWAALLRINDPPRFFAHGSEVGRVVDEGMGPSISHLSPAELKGHIDRLAVWLKAEKGGGRSPARPPKDVIEDMLAMDKPLPRIKGITGTPVFDAEGVLCLQEGYQTTTGLFYHPGGAVIPEVPDRPDATDLERAKMLIGREWLGDFPFNDAASRAQAIAIPLTAMARELITGPTPLFAVDAPSAGTGKGLLLRGVALVVEGAEPAVMTETADDDEMRKRITAMLVRGRPLIQLDNVKRRLESAALEGVLTSTVWSDRILGRTQSIDVPNRSVWLVTGNNLQMGTEIARRTVWIRLDSKEDRPWERNSFRHADLAGWVTRHRHELLWALLVLVQNWLSKGRPAWEGKPLGSFEAWSHVLGGILCAADIPGFLTNRQELYKRADQETEEWRAFIERVWDEVGDRPATTAALYPMARELLPGVFGLKDGQSTEHSLRTRLGNEFKRRVDRRFGDFYWRSAPADSHSKAAQWRVELASHHGETAGVWDSGGRTPAQPPQDSEHFSDSTAGVAVVAGVDRESSTTSLSDSHWAAAGAKQPPQAPQLPQPDSDASLSFAEVEQQPPRSTVQAPQCRRCGRAMSINRVRDICGLCTPLT